MAPQCPPSSVSKRNRFCGTLPRRRHRKDHLWGQSRTSSAEGWDPTSKWETFFGNGNFKHNVRIPFRQLNMSTVRQLPHCRDYSCLYVRVHLWATAVHVYFYSWSSLEGPPGTTRKNFFPNLRPNSSFFNRWSNIVLHYYNNRTKMFLNVVFCKFVFQVSIQSGSCNMSVCLVQYIFALKRLGSA